MLSTGFKTSQAFLAEKRSENKQNISFLPIFSKTFLKTFFSRRPASSLKMVETRRKKYDQPPASDKPRTFNEILVEDYIW
jgi:hypothetical protein